jgi:uncharacterized protein with von Willebrand factor type A (vWA) domain
LQNQLLRFIDALRSAGLSPSVAESLDAMRAVSVAGVSRQVLREGLAATLVKDHADRPLFDEIFDRHFAVEGRRRGRGQRPAASGEEQGRGGGATGSHAPAPRQRAEQPPAPNAPEAERKSTERRDQLRSAQEPRSVADAGRQLRAQRALRRLDFEAMDSESMEACDVLVADLAHRFSAHLSRRQRNASRGRLNIRATVRRALDKGGVLIEPAFRHRRPGRPDLVALCDHSHSVATASRFLLGLLSPARHFFRRVRLFAYVDAPVEVSIEGGRLVPHDPLDLYARSDFGNVLVSFWQQHHPLLTHNTLLLILGDGRNNRRPPRADVLARMRLLVRQVVWLNPEPRSRWNSGDSVIAAYAKSCDSLIAATNIEELYKALKQTFRTL